jgi:ribosomal protein S2
MGHIALSGSLTNCFTIDVRLVQLDSIESAEGSEIHGLRAFEVVDCSGERDLAEPAIP